MMQKIPEQLEIVEVAAAQPDRQGPQARAPQAVRARYARCAPAGRSSRTSRGEGLQLGPVGRRRRAGHAQPHRRGAVRRGAARVRRGAAFSLSIPMRRAPARRPTVRGHPAAIEPELKMKYVNARSPATPTTSRRPTTVELSLQAATHIDALSHVGYEGLLYNDARHGHHRTTARPGSASSSVRPDHTRGVLLDIARLARRGVLRGRHAIRRRPRRARRRPASPSCPATRCSCAPGRWHGCGRGPSARLPTQPGFGVGRPRVVSTTRRSPPSPPTPTCSRSSRPSTRGR